MKCNQIEYTHDEGDEMDLCGHDARFILTTDCPHRHIESSHSCLEHLLATLQSQMVCSACDVAGKQEFCRFVSASRLGPVEFAK